MKGTFRLVAIVIAVSLILLGSVGVSAQGPIGEPVFAVRLSAGGGVQVVNLGVSGVVGVFRDIANGSYAGSATVNVGGYDLNASRIPGCLLYLSGQVVEQSGLSIMRLFPPISIIPTGTWSGTICLREGSDVITDLRSGKIPPLFYFLLSGQLPDTGVRVTHDGPTTTLVTPLFTLVVDNAGSCSWGWRLYLTSTGDLVAERNYPNACQPPPWP